MNKNVIILLAIAIVLPLAWWLGSPLFISKTVDEAFPFELPSPELQAMMSPQDIESKVSEIMTSISQEGVMEAMSEEGKAKLEERLMSLSAQMPDKAMTEEMPSNAPEWQILSKGSFKDADSFHKGSGTATVFQATTAQEAPQRILRLEDFSSANGPDLHVLLVENSAATRSEELGDYLDLGSLKGNIGNQNYEIPADADLSKYKGVMIYCMPFHVVFSIAAFEQ
jgi:hypothetical protein